MILSKKDFSKLQIPLLGLLIAIVLASTLVWWNLSRIEQATQHNKAANTSKNQIEQRLRQVRTEEQELKEKAQIFQEMQRSGIAGEEKRLDWTEMLQRIQREMRLPGMNYELGAQIPLDAVSNAAFSYYTSPMRIQLRLLHEEDLLNFLARIQKEASALVLVRSCKLSPLPSQNSERISLALLTAECDLQWVTVRRSAEQK